MMERKQNQTPQGQTARVLVEFLEVAITCVVFLKGVYPSGAFERRRYMNVVVQRALHPQLRYYIHATVSGLLPFLQKVLSAFIIGLQVHICGYNIAQPYPVPNPSEQGHPLIPTSPIGQLSEPC
ncbi:DNA polymerase zeta processivity subunit-like [Gastrolobium bilobum]|uniref:DNA polymerase zeta processivity subunit-like n=1 Tax=Gastrolobium bilobum TaxID=150636 RepID=UPI002AB05119|nr:DNA polymerase zeta processivity subunit-like [Gastrolobium bilobum]